MLEKYEKVLEKSKSRVVSLGEDIIKAYELAYDSFVDQDIQKATKARDILKDSHSRNSKIDNEIIKTLALFSPEAKDLRVLVSYLKITSELTRIADYISSYAKSVKMHISGEFSLDDLRDETISFQKSTLKSLKSAIESIEAESEERADYIYRKVRVEESKCDDIYSILEKNITEQMCLRPDDTSDFILFIKSIRKLERVSDRSVNIAKLSYYAQSGGKLKL
jgi:phosphate transport system protein